MFSIKRSFEQIILISYLPKKINRKFYEQFLLYIYIIFSSSSSRGCRYVDKSFGPSKRKKNLKLKPCGKIEYKSFVIDRIHRSKSPRGLSTKYPQENHRDINKNSG
jgi:hypothetical protein